jgi:hypothetical protein
MKPFFYSPCLLLLVLATRPVSAQAIPNNGFELWTTTANSVEKPTNWQTTDDILTSISAPPAGYYYNTGTITKSTDAHGGSYAISLATLTLGTGANTTQIPGFIVLGNRVKTDAQSNVYAGLPYTARPTQMQFYYKLTGPGAATDNAGIQVLLTRTTGGITQPIAQASTVLTPTTSGYSAKTLTLTYSSSAAPDSITIYAASGNVSTPKAGTTLLLDDITLSGTALAIRADVALQELLTVAPNPSPAGRFVISSPAQPDLAAAPLTVLDALGRTVVRQPAQPVATTERTLDLSSLPLGIYLLRLDSKQGTIVRQLVVK